MVSTSLIHPKDNPELRKQRRDFFTPAGIAKFVANWAIRVGANRVLEPAAMVDRLLGTIPVTMYRAARERRAEAKQL